LAPLSTIRDHLANHGPGPQAVVILEHNQEEDMQHRGDDILPPNLYFDPYPDDDLEVEGHGDSDASDSIDEDEPEVGVDNDEQPAPTDDYFATVAAMAEQLVEAMAHNQITQQGVTVVLRIMHGTVYTHCPPLLVSLIPADSRLLMKTAHIEPLEHHYRHFCPGPPQMKTKSLQLARQSDHYLFPLDPAETWCPMCADDTRFVVGTTKPRRSALFYDLDGYLRRSFQLQELRDLQMGWRQDPRMKRSRGQFKWVMDGQIVAGGKGKIFKEMEEGEECVVFAGCRDATVISHMSNTSLLPIVFDNLSLPERIRKAPETKYLAALFPPGMKATQVTQRPIAEMFARRQPGTRRNLLQTQFVSDAICIRRNLYQTQFVSDAICFIV
jgi:hypothetical protein